MDNKNTNISIDSSITSARRTGLIAVLTVVGLIAFWFVAGNLTKEYPYHI